MAKATMNELERLMGLVVRSLSQRIEQDMEDQLPTDAATLGAAIKLLKDNEVHVEPTKSEDLTGLREKLQQQLQAQADARRNSRQSALQLVREDMQKTG